MLFLFIYLYLTLIRVEYYLNTEKLHSYEAQDLFLCRCVLLHVMTHVCCPFYHMSQCGTFVVQKACIRPDCQKQHTFWRTQKGKFCIHKRSALLT